MKSSLPALVAFSLAAASAQAYGLTLADGAPQVTVRVAGASGLSRAFGPVVGAQLCKPGTVTAYWDDSGTIGALDAQDGTRYQAYYCAAKAGLSGVTENARLLVVKRDRDGSYLGVGPVVNRQPIEFMTLDNCIDRGVSVVAPAPRFLCTSVANAIPDAGLSDVERALWAARGQVAPAAGITEVRGAFGQGYGIGVSGSLYEALQAAQGLTVGATDVANQPSISRQQYTSVVSLSGGYRDASFLTGVSGKLYNCRRPATSGTQAVSDIFFLDNPCKRFADPLFGQLSPRGAGIVGSLQTIENSTTADVVNCLKDADPALSGQALAIGVVSLENVSGSGWRFIKLDGVSPNFYALDPDAGGPLKRGDPDPTQRKNVVEGRYSFVSEGSMLWRDDSTFAGATGILQRIADGFTSPSLVNLTGVYSVRKSPNVTHALFPDRVHKGTRFGNSCQSMQLFE